MFKYTMLFTKQKTLNISDEGLMWLRAESNHRHKDFQSSALPTELRSHEKYVKFIN